MFRLVCFVLALLALDTRAGGAVGAVVTQWVLYKSATDSIAPRHVPNNWNVSGYAYTANTVSMPFDQWKAAGAQILSAQVQVAWKANSVTGNTGVGIFMCPSQHDASAGLIGCDTVIFFAANDITGPASYTPGCAVNPGGPFPCWGDITAKLQGYLAAGLSDQHMVLVTYGNTQDGPIVWSAEAYITWGT